MKILQWVAWLSVILGVILMIMGGLFLVKFNPMAFRHTSSFFVAADSFFLLSIALFIFTKHRCECCCDTKDNNPIE
jgi:hypothetical protein